jgi:hypothetical protein
MELDDNRRATAPTKRRILSFRDHLLLTGAGGRIRTYVGR